MTPWKKLMNKNYLGSWDLEEGKGYDSYYQSTPTMKMSMNPQSGKEKCLLIDFEEPNFKPMILNNTNCKAIEKATDSKYIEDWAGKRIALFVVSISAFGEVTDAIRVRPTAPREPKVIPCEECGKPITASNGMDAETVSAYTFKKYGRHLCAECAQKEKEAK
jgi:hypothetical protein